MGAAAQSFHYGHQDLHGRSAEDSSFEVILRKCLVCRYLKYKAVGPKESPELMPYMQDLLDATMEFSGSQKTKPLPKRLVAKKVLLNNNMMLYGKYVAARRAIRETRKNKVVPVDVETQGLAQEMQRFRRTQFHGKETSRALDQRINEVYLWHGTSYHAVKSIFDKDFVVGMKAHVGLFGRGLYLAESCAKADEYAHEGKHEQDWYSRLGHMDEVDPLPEGAPICAMLLCRVALGRVQVVTQAGEDLTKQISKGQYDATGRIKAEYDSLIGARSYHRREFILATKDAIFPEFAVLYTRDRVTKSVPQQLTPINDDSPNYYAADESPVDDSPVERSPARASEHMLEVVSRNLMSKRTPSQCMSRCLCCAGIRA